MKTRKLLVPMRCPHCGAAIKVQLQRVDKDTRCSECGKVFQGNWGVDPNHNSVSGIHLAMHRKVKPAEPSVIVVAAKKTWKSQAGKFGVFAIPIGIALLIFLGLWSSGGATLPQTLSGRGEYVMRAWLDNDLDAFRRIVASSTRKDAEAWFKKTRDLFFHELKDDRLDLGRCEIKFQNAQTNEALVIVHVYRLKEKRIPVPVEATAQTETSSSSSFSSNPNHTPAQPLAPTRAGLQDRYDRVLSFSLYWQSKGQDRWFFDGKRTLERSGISSLNVDELEQ